MYEFSPGRVKTKFTFQDLTPPFPPFSAGLNSWEMGCYGIGINRIIAAIIEQNNDKDGIIWPKSISPYQVLIIEVASEDKNASKLADALYSSLTENKAEVLLDDRPERAGIKFKDADLIGIPTQIIIGPKNLKDKAVEIKIRKTHKRLITPMKDIIPQILEKGRIN